MRRSSFAKELKKKLIIKANLIISVEEPREPEESKKARIVARGVGSRDYDKRVLITYSPTETRNSIKLILIVATGENILIFIRDTSQAYVSTDTALLRDKYLIRPKELNLNPEVLWKVKKLLYGLLETSIHWFETYI